MYAKMSSSSGRPAAWSKDELETSSRRPVAIRLLCHRSLALVGVEQLVDACGGCVSTDTPREIRERPSQSYQLGFQLIVSSPQLRELSLRLLEFLPRRRAPRS